jgi:hypothetical protein
VRARVTRQQRNAASPRRARRIQFSAIKLPKNRDDRVQLLLVNLAHVSANQGAIRRYDHRKRQTDKADAR